MKGLCWCGRIKDTTIHSLTESAASEHGHVERRLHPKRVYRRAAGAEAQSNKSKGSHQPIALDDALKTNELDMAHNTLLNRQRAPTSSCSVFSCREGAQNDRN